LDTKPEELDTAFEKLFPTGVKHYPSPGVFHTPLVRREGVPERLDTKLLVLDTTLLRLDTTLEKHCPTLLKIETIFACTMRFYY